MHFYLREYVLHEGSYGVTLAALHPEAGGAALRVGTRAPAAGCQAAHENSDLRAKLSVELYFCLEPALLDGEDTPCLKKPEIYHD